jgi:hypothetical protein
MIEAGAASSPLYRQDLLRYRDLRWEHRGAWWREVTDAPAIAAHDAAPADMTPEAADAQRTAISAPPPASQNNGGRRRASSRAAGARARRDIRPTPPSDHPCTVEDTFDACRPVADGTEWHPP